jgi:hypothetical protein
MVLCLHVAYVWNVLPVWMHLDLGWRHQAVRSFPFPPFLPLRFINVILPSFKVSCADRAFCREPERLFFSWSFFCCVSKPIRNFLTIYWRSSCNIYNPTGPHCPWCAAPPSAGWIPQWGSAVVVIVSLITFTYLVPKRWYAKLPSVRQIPFAHFLVRLRRFAVTPFLGLAIWFVFMFIAAISWKFAYDYPYFLWNGPPPTTPATTPTPLTHMTEL